MNEEVSIFGETKNEVLDMFGSFDNTDNESFFNLEIKERLEDDYFRF